MPTVTIPTLRIIYKQQFVLQYLYRVTRKWLVENEYKDPNVPSDETMESGMEALYFEKKGTEHKQNERGWRIWWRTIKPVSNMSGGRSNYYMYHLNIDWYVIQTTDMEIMHEGKKMVVQAGELQIEISPSIQVPELVSHPLLKYIDYFFRTRIIKRNIDEHKKLLYQDAYRLQAMMKKYLELKMFLPPEEAFHEKFEFI